LVLRAAIANMAPEYVATLGFFPVDEKTIDYFVGTGRTKAEIEAFEACFKAQKMFGVSLDKGTNYTRLVKLDMATAAPSLSGPAAARGFNQPGERLAAPVTTPSGLELKNGDVLIAGTVARDLMAEPLGLEPQQPHRHGRAAGRGHQAPGRGHAGDHVRRRQRAPAAGGAGHRHADRGGRLQARGILPFVLRQLLAA
jgi:hypothetical protein